MKFWRSMKSDKHESAEPQQDARSIPPKKVIKAVYDYTAPSNTDMFLSFNAGDFLHVIGRENDPEWYEACNPLRNERGFVPARYFENVSRTAPISGDASQSITSTTHDSGNAKGSTPPNITSGPSKALGVIYGIVSYDFHAEQPDELDAKAGEAIIVVAQSTAEWFVAKPIARLGGPGLIPVSFVQIRDTTTGKPAEDPLAAVQKAGVPGVKEWKKAAGYNTSIR